MAVMEPTRLARPEPAEYGSKVYENITESSVWVAELKMDGWRIMAKCGDFVELWTRHGRRLEDAPREIRTALAKLPEGAVIDGELVRGQYFDRMYVWDVLHDGEKDLRGRPYSERIMRLGEIVGREVAPYILTVERAVTAKDKRMMWKCREVRGGEGVVYKRLADAYPPDGGAVWLKVK